MKTNINNRLLLPPLIAALALLPARPATAQTFTTLHSFTAGSTNTDGATPLAGLILSSNILYGTTQAGGSSGKGTVFRVNTDGSSFTNLYSFTATVSGTNSDGAAPRARLLLSGTNLYGMAYEGGSSDCGTVFRVNTDGTGFTNLYNFTALAPITYTNRDGAFPLGGLVLSGDTLYGTASYGGANGSGTVFALKTDGTGFTNLHTFTASSGSPATNSDGAIPEAGLVLSGNTLYGTAYQGGTNGAGTVFALNTNGTGFTKLHDLATDRDGAFPYGVLVLSGDTLYGTASYGGTNGNGTVFALKTNGTGFSILHAFTATSGVYPAPATNSEGGYPLHGLVLSGNTLYGAAADGGKNGTGTMFALNPDGTGFTNLYNFSAADPITGTNCDGAGPNGGLILSGNTLYGTAIGGGDSYWGTVFSLALAGPQLAIMLSGTNVILTWPEPGFTLQSATSLAAPVWTPVAGQNVVTNPISGTQMFYRLSQ